MGDKTAIQWTDATWNPTTGCTKVSAGCKNCYAERVFPRAYGKKRKFSDVQVHEDRLGQPLRWKRLRRIFVDSMSDLFHESIPEEFIDRVWAVMALCPQHRFQVLTKRPERMLRYLGDHARAHFVRDAVLQWHTDQEPTGYRLSNSLSLHPLGIANELSDRLNSPRWPLPNVWLGVSVENQEMANERIPLLLRTPAKIRFVSYEPALKKVSFNGALVKGYGCNGESPDPDCIECGWKCNTLDWIIVGGESGPRARPFDIAWAREIILEGRVANVPVFIKQLGSKPIQRFPIQRFNDGAEIHDLLLKDSHGGDWSEWTADLRVREFPKTTGR